MNDNMTDPGKNEWHAGDEYDDDDDDDIEFVPGGDDQLEDEYVDDGDDDDGEDDEDFPTLLEGALFRDPSKGGNLCFEQEGLFCLVLQDSVPESFQISSPIVDTPFKFAGWIQSPATWYEFDIVFSQRPESDADPMVVQFLEAQDEMKKSSSAAAVPMKGGKSTGDEDDEEEDQKVSAKPSLKAPPSYDSDGKKPAPASNDDKANQNSSSFIFGLSATQVGGDNPIDDDDSRIVTFHGSFRKPSAFDDKIFLLCPVNLAVKGSGAVEVAAASAGSSGASAAAAPSAAAAGASAASRKRTRSALDNEDDESVVEEEKGGVLNELIALHDDANLSTEQLRAKYYGGGGAVGTMDDDRKKPPPSSSRKSTDDEDDDDDIGF